MNAIHRTPSEIQLCEDATIADYRDYCVFLRIVNGISSGQSAALNFDFIYVNIPQTRYFPPEEAQSLNVQYKLLLQQLETPTHNVPPVIYPIIDPGDNHPMILDEDEIFVLDL
jgi:hypothetical protein